MAAMTPGRCAVRRADFFATASARSYVPAAPGIWCEAQGIKSRFRLLTDAEHGLPMRDGTPGLHRYAVSRVPEEGNEGSGV